MLLIQKQEAVGKQRLASTVCFSIRVILIFVFHSALLVVDILFLVISFLFFCGVGFLGSEYFLLMFDLLIANKQGNLGIFCA